MREKYKKTPEMERADDKARYAKDPEKWKAMHRRYYEKHKAKTIERNWVSQIGKLGCTKELYYHLLEKQKGLCAICKRENVGKKRLAVDHDHETGKVRGLLCNLCNTALGAFDDNPEMLARALEYLNAVE